MKRQKFENLIKLNVKSTFNIIEHSIPVRLKNSKWAIRCSLATTQKNLTDLTNNTGEHTTLINTIGINTVYMFPFGRKVRLKNINNRNTIVDFELSIWKTDTISGGNPIEIYHRFNSSQPDVPNILTNNNVVVQPTDFLHFFVRSKASIVDVLGDWTDINILFENI
jgi:hypothetical protein